PSETCYKGSRRSAWTCQSKSEGKIHLGEDGRPYPDGNAIYISSPVTLLKLQFFNRGSPEAR
ncbi:MAG: hypothetical protein ACRD5J_13110, partial [Nitrososphaeraceae archaeon]